MKKMILPLVLLLASLTGCASTDKTNTPRFSLQTGQAGKVFIYRKQSLQASLADAYLGTEENGYFSKLDENQYIELSVNPGFHTFTAGTHGSVGSKYTVKVTQGENVCVEARPNHEELEWLVIPFVNAFVPSFVLEETECPSMAELAMLTPA